MSATIKFYDPAESDPARPRQLVCNVWSLRESEVVDAVIVSQPISSDGSRSAAPSQVDLPGAGTYLVEVIHPGGRRTRRTVNVAEFDLVRFELPRHAVSVRQFPSSGSLMKKSPARVVMSALQHATAPIEVEICAISPLAQSSSSLLNPRAFIAGVLACRHKGYTVARFPSSVASFVIDPRATAPLPFEQPGRRSWLLARGGGESWTLIAFPDAWIEPDGPVPLEVIAESPTLANAHRQWDISLSLLDSAHGSLLEFLSSRDLASAWATFSAIPNLQDPEATQNPYSFAVGAYTRALALEEFSSARSDDAPELPQLTKYDWLPDICIAQTWQILRQVETNSDMFTVARRQILQALDQGFPCFSIGLRVLCDALNYLAVVDPKDELVGKALGAATRAELACIPGEIFTTIDVSRLLALSKKTAT